MSKSHLIAEYLPFLRRYARALTGSQSGGDAYVRATLEAVLAREAALEGDDPRVALYRLFHAVWSANLNERHVPGIASAPATADERLQSLRPSNREAMLLTSLEGFSRASAAKILGKSDEAVAREIAEAQQAIEQLIASRVLIVEDEVLISLHLETLMRELGHDVVGVAATRDEAVRLAFARRPELVLADIRLADGSSGIEAAGDIVEAFDVPIVFVTAYPERLLTGERLEPTYLITKPFLPEALKAVVSQALFFHPSQQRAA